MTREQELESIIHDIWWMARRYADGRNTCAPWQYNRAIDKAVELGMEFKPDTINNETTIHAKDGKD